MHTVKFKLSQILPTVVVAFMAGYFFKWLTKDHSITDVETETWLAALGTICSIVGAFVLGERQMHILWKTSAAADEQYVDKKRASILAMATAAYSAMDRLDSQYRNTLQERMRILVVYHGDTFASLIEALAAIPLHEFDSAEAATALAGLKKNMIEAQQLVDQFVAGKNRAEEVLFAESIVGIDLRSCKTYAESHYQRLVQALKPQS
jgi:cellobiose-specific phosphotransferase system component IIA